MLPTARLPTEFYTKRMTQLACTLRAQATRALQQQQQRGKAPIPEYTGPPPQKFGIAPGQFLAVRAVLLLSYLCALQPGARAGLWLPLRWPLRSRRRLGGVWVVPVGIEQ